MRKSLLLVIPFASLLMSPVLFADDSLQSAFRKEFTFLEGQLHDLQQRSQKFKFDSEREVQAETKKNRSLNARVVELENRNDQLTRLLTDAEQQMQSAEELDSVIANLLEQAAATTGAKEQLLDQNQTPATRLTTAFQRGTNQLVNQASVRQHSGDFFLADGSRVNGSIIDIGQVAVFGIAEQGSGALAPAGAGHLKLAQPLDPERVKAMVQGVDDHAIDLFLFENRDQAIDIDNDDSLLTTLNKGGAIAWIIVVLGLAALAAVVLRALFLRRSAAGGEALLARIQPYIENGKLDEAETLCAQSRGATARVVRATLRNLERERDHIEDIISEGILHESIYLNRYGAFILIIAAVSPLLGLFGTVTGMIATFDVITQFGTGDPKLLSGGISVALITTQVGLAVAIPALILGNLLNGWSNRIKDGMERSALRVLNLYQQPLPLRQNQSEMKNGHYAEPAVA